MTQETDTSAIAHFGQVAVLCIGDVMLDRFVSGSVHRISPESPVPVLSIREVRLFPGGAANVARNIAALGGRCTLMGVVGDDGVAHELRAAVAQIEGVTPVLVTAPGRPTTEKVRFVAQGQQLLRADQEEPAALPAALEQALLAGIAAQLAGQHVMVLSDYAKGVLSPAVVQGAIALAHARGMPVVVDPKSPEMARYGGATIVTPNAKEVQAATGLDPTEDDAVAVEAGRRMLAAAAIESVLITRAHKGMTLVARDAEPVHLPASAREVFDVVGAGDTVVATLALAVGAGQALAAASMLANVAAGIVVGKRGTATVTPTELANELSRLRAGPLAPLQSKILRGAGIALQAHAWRREGQVVGLVNASFGPLRGADIALLNLARSRCDRLVVSLRSDVSAARLAVRDRRALGSEGDRATVLAALAAVDAVALFDDDTPLALVAAVLPQLLVGDSTHGEIVGAAQVERAGGRVIDARDAAA